MKQTKKKKKAQACTRFPDRASPRFVRDAWELTRVGLLATPATTRRCRCPVLPTRVLAASRPPGASPSPTALVRLVAMTCALGIARGAALLALRRYLHATAPLRSPDNDLVSPRLAIAGPTPGLRAAVERLRQIPQGTQNGPPSGPQFAIFTGIPLDFVDSPFLPSRPHDPCRQHNKTPPLVEFKEPPCHRHGSACDRCNWANSRSSQRAVSATIHFFDGDAACSTCRGWGPGCRLVGTQMAVLE